MYYFLFMENTLRYWEIYISLAMKSSSKVYWLIYCQQLKELWIRIWTWIKLFHHLSCFVVALMLKSQTEIATIVNMLSKITMQKSSSTHELFLSNLYKMQEGMKMNTYWTLWVHVKIFSECYFIHSYIHQIFTGYVLGPDERVKYQRYLFSWNSQSCLFLLEKNKHIKGK